MVLKRLLNDELQTLLAPIRARRAEFLADKGELTRILAEGTRRAQAVTGEVLAQVRQALGLAMFV